MKWPTRVVNTEQARREHGDLLDRLAPWLAVEDPLADAVVAEPGWHPMLERALASPRGAVTGPIGALVAAHATVPPWVDEARARRGGRVFFRTAAVGAIVLGARSLVSGYASPAGNKPLAWTGTIARHGQRRLAETGKYVAAVSAPDGLLPWRDGWRLSLRVRLMHAHVRHLIHRSGRWRADTWGAPINQHDLLATSLLFSQVFIDGVRAMGLHVTTSEAEDHLHLWRWASWLMGVQLELLPETEARAREVSALIAATQGPPDDDARALVQELLRSPQDRRWAAELAAGLCYGLLPRDQAEGLGLRRTRWRHVVRLSQLAVAPVELARRLLPPVEEGLIHLGVRHWEEAVRSGLGGGEATFRAPDGLTGLPR
jgi:ER-bound oxygenase mpaB/B'/Rubber oxygenase, catalytic domain